MESWQFSPSLLWNASTILLSVGLLLTKLNFCHLLLSISLDVCFDYQFKRCSYVSFRELIVSCSIFMKIDSSRVFPFLSLSCWMEFPQQDVKTRMMIESTSLWSATWIMKIVLDCAPSVSLPHVLNLGTRFLFSGGELSHPYNLCLQIVASASMHHVKLQINLNWGCWNPSIKWIQLGSNKKYIQWTQNAPWKCSWFLIKVKTSAKNDEHISRSFLDFWIKS